MKKADLMEYGIPEAKIRAFNEVYWNDVRKQAARMVEEAKGQEAAPSTASMREAIAAMVRVIPDPVRLSMILNNVNKHYQYYTNEQNGVNGSKKNSPNDQSGANDGKSGGKLILCSLILASICTVIYSIIFRIEGMYAWQQIFSLIFSLMPKEKRSFGFYNVLYTVWKGAVFLLDSM